MGLDLVVHRGAQPVMALTTANVNYELLQKYVEQQEQKSEKTFPGERVAFKKGFYTLPDTKDKKGNPAKFDLDLELVANAPNVIFYWRKWVDKRPTYAAMAYPVLGQDLPGREELGDDDQSKWEMQKDQDTGQMKAVDPWQRGACVVLRDRETGTVYHFDSTSMGGQQFMMALLKAFAADGRTKPGQLPVIKLDTEERQHWERKNVTFHVPVFDIVDWVKATEADNPKKGGVNVVEDDREEVEIKSVSAKRRSTEEEKPVERVKSRKVADIEEEEEEAPKPKAKAAMRKVEIEDDEEEEAPKPRRRRPADDDED